MIKNRFVFVVAVLLFFLFSPAILMAQEKGKQVNNPPFLITGKLPHLTKLLMQHWEDAELHLSDKQKSKLLIIRDETISSVERLGKEIGALEKQVVEGRIAGKTPMGLHTLVEDIAKLKTEATMVHLYCLYKTSEILDQKQLDYLNN